MLVRGSLVELVFMSGPEFPVKYRRANAKDFLQIAALDRVAWGDAPEDRFIPDGEHAWRLWVEYAIVAVAERDAGTILGAGLAFPCLLEQHGKLLAVHKLFVEEDARGKGIGTGLFQQITDLADKDEYRAFLSVKPNNQSAIEVYAKLGFRTSEEIKGYYRSYEDRLIMVRKPISS